MLTEFQNYLSTLQDVSDINKEFNIMVSDSGYIENNGAPAHVAIEIEEVGVDLEPDILPV